MDDVTLPPGGGGWQPPSSGSSSGCGPTYLTRQGRDLRLDLLRGYFVVAMIVDHVRGNSPLYLLTGGNRFYVSAAEGFILTSGLVAGLVYRRLIDRDGLERALFKVLTRAASLYLLTVGLTFLFLPVSELLYLPWAQGVDLSNPLGFVVSVLTLHRTYYLVDVMLLYTTLFLISPLIFLLLSRGKTWQVLAGSWLLWGLFQLFPDYVSLPWPIAGNYLFQISAWQLLFFTGMVIGWDHERIPALRPRSTHVSLVLSALALAGLIVVFFILDAPTDLIQARLWGPGAASNLRSWFEDAIFSKTDLRVGRLVAASVTFGFLFLSVTVFWRQVQKWLGWLLLPLGQHALYAYTAHIVVIALVAMALLPFKLASASPWWMNAAIQAGSVLLIWLLVKWQFLALTPKTKRLWYASPAAMAAVILIVLSLFPAPSHPGLAAATVPANAPQVQLARRYGTPIPPESLAGAPVPAAQPTPTPPNTASRILSDGVDRVSGYLGEIEGSFHERWFYSAALDRDMPYYVYLPPDYGTAGRRYPVLYMLHGLGGDREEWVAYGLIDAADQQIHVGNVPPMIIVLPQGDRGYWINNTGNGPRWGDYVIHNLVPHIDATYRTLRHPSARAIGGLSMGGWGALYQAFTRPDVFGIVGAHSPSLRPEGPAVALLGTGDEFASKDPLQLARKLDTLSRLKIWIDAGDQDPWIDQTTTLHGVLAGRGIDHSWNPFSGGHDWPYWREHVLDYVRFYGHALAQQ